MDIRDQKNLLPHTFLTLLYKKTYNTTFSWRKNFTKLTLLLILPALSLMFLAETEASKNLLSHMIHKTAVYISLEAANEHQLSDPFSTDEYLFLGIVKSLCLLALFVLSPLPISAAVHYEVTSNLNREVGISKMGSVNIAFRVFKRLLINSYQGYIGALFFITLLMVVFTCFVEALGAFTFITSLGFLYLMVLVYLCLTWHMMMVNSVLDEAYSKNNNPGSKQLESYEIIDGKMWAKAILLFKLVFVHVIRNLAYQSLVFHEMSCWLLYGFSCFLSFSMFSLFALIVQTAAFLICKSYRLEKFEKWCSLLGDDMVEACQSGNYSVKDKDIQKEQLDA